MSRQQPIYLCEVIVRNCFAGRRFMLRNRQDIRDFGLSPESVKIKARQKDNNVLFGIRFTPVNVSAFNEEEAIKAGYGEGWKDISAMFIRYPSRFRLRSKPIIGEVILGDYQGEYLSLFSLSDIGHYFPVESVRKSIINQVPYSGIAWRYAKDYQEAEMFYQQNEQKHFAILKSHMRYQAKQRGWVYKQGLYAAGYQSALGYLLRAEKMLSNENHLDGIVLLHKAVAEYQVMAKRKIGDDRVASRFAQLAASIAPKTDKNLLESINIPTVIGLIKQIVKQLKRRA